MAFRTVSSEAKTGPSPTVPKTFREVSCSGARWMMEGFGDVSYREPVS